MLSFTTRAFALSLLVQGLLAQQIVNGQIYTPGIAIVDAPQPNTPLGGDLLEVALDVSSDGQLQLPPFPDNAPSAIWNITLFLSSYTTGKNFTISNGTATGGNASLGEVMLQEPGSTVKHVKWVWPDCLVGDGQPQNDSSARGLYNISIRQNFRLNGSDEYTIFDLPIQVTNSIPAESKRPSCDSLNNPLLSADDLAASANNFTRIPGTAIETSNSSNSSNSSNTSDASGINVGGLVHIRTALGWLWITTLALMYSL